MASTILAELGIVCAHCDGFNAPKASLCIACGKPLGSAAPAAAPSAAAAKPAAPVRPAPTPASTPAARPAPAAAPSAPPASAATVRAAPARAAALAAAVPAEHLEAAPSPARPAAQADRAKLVVLKGSTPGAVFRLSAASTAAGSSKGPLLFPDDPFVSPQHATFHFQDNRLFVRDDGSPSGTYVRLRAPQVLPAGALFAAGERLFRFSGPMPSVPASVPMPYGAPAPAGPLFLVEEILEGGRLGRSCARTGPTIAIGRVGCELNYPTDAQLQPRHCEIALEPTGAVLRDCASPDGVFVRLPPHTDCPLTFGDSVRIGRQVLRVEAP